MNGSGPGYSLRLNRFRLRQSNKKAASAHPGFPVEKFEPVLSCLFQWEALKLDISLNRTLMSDLDLHLRQGFGLPPGPPEVHPHGTCPPFLKPVTFLHQEPEEHPHPAVPGGQLEGIDDIEKALELYLSLGRRYDEVTE